MGLIGWIKKEIESSSRHRRQSAPAPIIHSLSSPNGNRDEAYLRAVAKFNEWRNSQRFERLNETKNASAISQEVMSKTTGDDISITDVEIKDDERARLMHTRRHKKKQQAAAVYSNLGEAEAVANKNKRLSLPLMTNGGSNRSERRKIIKSKPSAHPIDEIEEFEMNHCQKFEDFSFAIPSTPPSKFFRDSSKPYEEEQPPVVESSTKVETKKATPKRLMGRNMLRRNKGKAPQPPTLEISSPQNAVKSPPGNASESTMNFANGSYKHYDISSASIMDEFIISSRAYKGNLRREQQARKINSVGESASSGSLSSESEKIALKQQRRHSPPYQTVINKHGDEVEYALPYNERDSILDIPPLPNAPIPPATTARAQRTQHMPFDQIIDQNFKFLNSKMDFLNSQIGTDAEECMLDRKPSGGGSVFDPVDASFTDVRRQNLQVTDLDKSNETGLAFPIQTGDILKDLDALAKWSENCGNANEDRARISPAACYASRKGVKIIESKSLRYKPGSLRNAFSTPLEFSNGYFHKTPITLRSTLPNDYNINNFADIACMREFEVLCQVKHFSVVTLMGICFDLDLRITSLVMEPFDYTLNHYLHQMDKFYNIQQTASIVHQIASAVQYLNECGFVHSNISSHAVLIRDHPSFVKLSSLELATEILPTEAIGKIYRLKNVNENVEIFTLEMSDFALSEKYTKLSKQHFYNRTSLPVAKMTIAEYDDENEYRQPYSIPYRRMFSMHYYQAPELLIPTSNTENVHVLPSPQTDVYGLALLLWEMINRVVPYVIYNNDDLISGLKQGNIQLPMFDQSSIIFKEIFNSCLHVNSSKRLADVSEFITMLEDLRLLGYEKDMIEVLEIIEPLPPKLNEYSEQRKAEKNIKNSDQRDKLREKIYFSHAESDTQKRQENALTTENLAIMGIRDTSKISESVQSAEIEPQLNSLIQPPGILQDDALERIRKTVEDQRGITPKKPTRRNVEEVQLPHHDMSKNSTMFQSFFDLNRLQTPKVDRDVVYERTSTLKKRLKSNTHSGQKKSVKGLFENDDNDANEKKVLEDQFQKMNAELNMIIQDYNKSDFMDEIVRELQHREKDGRESDLKPVAFLNQRALPNCAQEMSRSFEEINSKGGGEHNNNNKSHGKAKHEELLRRYSTDDSFSLPNTPIARQNMIRRNAWLSDGPSAATTTSCISDEIARRSLKFINSNGVAVSSEPRLPKQNYKKQYNVNIRIHRNDLDTVATTATPKSTNVSQTHNNSSVKIKLYNSTKQSPTIKINNVDLNKTSYSEDINKKYYPMMPEMLSDVIQNKRDRSSFNITSPPNDDDEVPPPPPVVTLRRKSLSFSGNRSQNDIVNADEENVIVPLPMSVRETIKLIEKTFNPSRNESAAVAPVSRVEEQSRKNEETQTEGDFEIMCNHCDEPKREEEEEEESKKKLNANDLGAECLMQASESIQKLDKMIGNGIPVPPPMPINRKQLIGFASVSSPTPKKFRTTTVTVNVKKITGRSSDVSQLQRIQAEQQTSRHSICNSNELIKRWQAHLKGKEAAALLSKNDEISASCDSLVLKQQHCNEEIAPASGGKASKIFCRNCGFTVIPAEIMQALQKNQGRISIASSVAESLPSIRYDESLQSLAAIRKWQQLADARSTEDLYIDDDFCQGITQSLAANMELLPPPDFFDSLDFNILSAEIFHTQEQEFDETLTTGDGGEQLHQIEGGAAIEKDEEKEPEITYEEIIEKHEEA